MASVWMDSFGISEVNSNHMPTTVLLLRADEGTTDGLFYTKYYKRILAGSFGWFHTGAAMEETQCFNQTFRYEPFLRDCLTNKVVGFAEACGLKDFAGRSPKTPALKAANFSNLQGGYWILISNMASEVHVSGVHSKAFLHMQDPI